MKDAYSFTNTRCRLQRVSDLKFFSGWVEQLTPASCRIRLKPSKFTVDKGDKFNVEIFGIDKVAAFIGEASSISGLSTELQYAEAIRYVASAEAARIVVAGIEGRINYEGYDQNFTLIDISEQGLGITVDRPILKSAEVAFEVYTNYGTVSATAEVRYCKTEQSMTQCYRLGLQINSLSRIDRARWQQLLGHAEAAA